MEMSRLTWDGTAEPVSRGQILRRERRQGNIDFPCSADHEQDWRPYPVDPYSYYMCDHTYIHHGDSPLLRPTGIQIATKSLPGAPEHVGNFSSSRRCLWVRTTVSTVSNAARSSEYELQATEMTVSDVLPIYDDSHQNVFLAIGGLHEDKLCDTLQAMALTNAKTVRQTSFLHIKGNPDRLGLLSPTHGQRSQQKITLQSILITEPKFLKVTSCRNKENIL